MGHFKTIRFSPKVLLVREPKRFGSVRFELVCPAWHKIYRNPEAVQIRLWLLRALLAFFTYSGLGFFSDLQREREVPAATSREGRPRRTQPIPKASDGAAEASACGSYADSQRRHKPDPLQVVSPPAGRRERVGRQELGSQGQWALRRCL